MVAGGAGAETDSGHAAGGEAAVQAAVAVQPGYGEVLARTISRETRVVEGGPTKPGKAIVEKTVDAEAAEPGDTLTFTIRCRNVGKEPLKSAA